MSEKTAEPTKDNDDPKKEIICLDPKMSIPDGLSYRDEFVSPKEAENLVKFIDNQKWQTVLCRRVQEVIILFFFLFWLSFCFLSLLVWLHLPHTTRYHHPNTHQKKIPNGNQNHSYPR